MEKRRERRGSKLPGVVRVPVVVDPQRQEGRLEERYLGFTFDTAQFVSDSVGGEDIWYYEKAYAPDLESDRLRALAASLGPSVLRIGGTDADGVYFCDREEACELPQSYRSAYPKGKQQQASYLTRKDIRRIGEFAEAIDAEIMFCLNFGPGPRDPATGAWADGNARQLIRYARSLPSGKRFSIWQAGNEPNLHFYFYGIRSFYRPSSYARDLKLLQRMIDEEVPGARIAAPAAYFDPREFIGDVFGFTKRVLTLDDGSVEIVSWHFYPTQSENCGSGPFDRPFPSTAGNLFDEEVMEKSRRYARYVRDAAAGRPVFLDETASAECGGQAGVSDTLLDALWSADWLGVAVQEGTRAILRQTLLGFDYGIVDPVGHDPRPTLLTLAAFRRFVARARLGTEVDRSILRVHAFCNPERANLITAVLVNPGPGRLVAEVGVDAAGILGASQWTISSPAGLEGTRATIEGQSIDEAGQVPTPPGTPVQVENGTALADVAPESLVFVALELRDPADPCVE